MSRRSKGEGSIYQRASDQRWIGSLDVSEGGRRQRRVVSAQTRQEVQRKLRELQNKVDRGEAISDARVTTEAFLRRWMEEALPGSIKESTLDQYRYILERYAMPEIGRIRLATLAPRHVEGMLRSMNARGLSARTQRQTRAVLRSALRTAERWELVGRNAAALVDPPRIGGSETDDTLSLDETRKLLETARSTPDFALVTLAVMTGLRKGELLALHWKDVDLDNAELTVRGTLKRRPGGGLYIDTPKTARGSRTIPIPSSCVRALRSHRRKQASDRMRLGPSWTEGDLVFPTPVGTPTDPRNATRRFHAITTEAGFGPRRFHSLRHTAATLMLTNGVALEVISQTLGHAGLAITADVYAKVTRSLERAAADAMDAAFSAGEMNG